MKLDNPDAASKTYWSIMNKFSNNKKIPIVPPVFCEGKLISDFERKSEIFSNQFASQFSLVKNAITSPNFEYKIYERLIFF